MGGKRQWPLEEIIWILNRPRDKWNIKDLANEYSIAFPNSRRNNDRKTLYTGIRYVQDNYMRNPSYNHDFSDDEIWFIMVKSSIHGGIVTKEVVKLFKQAFPDHDWKKYVDNCLAMETVVAKHRQMPPYSVQWQHDEVQFILAKRLSMLGWQELLTAFQLWRPRDEVTTLSLRYVYESLQLDRFRSINDFKNHLRNTTDYIFNESSTVFQNSRKRRYEGIESAIGSRNKRTRISPAQPQQEVSKEFKKILMHTNDVDASEHRFSEYELADSRFLEPYQLPNLNHLNPTVPLLQTSSTFNSQYQAQGPIYFFPDADPQQTMYEDWGQTGPTTPAQTIIEGNNPFSHAHRSEILPGSAPISSTTAPEWPPRYSWYRNDFQPFNTHMGSLSVNTRLSTFSSLEESQFTMNDDSWAMHHIQESQSSYTFLEGPAMQLTFGLKETTQQTEVIVPGIPETALTGEHTTLFQDINIVTQQIVCLQDENSQEPAIAIPYSLSQGEGIESAPKYRINNDILTWQANLHSPENDFATMYAVSNGAFGTFDCTRLQDFSSDIRTLDRQVNFQSHEELVISTPIMFDEFPDRLEIEKNQANSFNLNHILVESCLGSREDLFEPVSEVLNNLFCSPETDMHQYTLSRSKSSGVFSGEGTAYTDELHEAAVVTELGGYREFLPSNDVDSVVSCDSVDSESGTLDNPSKVITVGTHLALEHEIEDFSEQVSCPDSEALQELRAMSSSSQSAFLGIIQGQVLSHD